MKILILFFILTQNLNASEILSEINNFTKKPTLKCPGIRISGKCGDNICQKNRGEHFYNCPGDCSPALIKAYNQFPSCSGVSKKFTPKNIPEVVQAVRYAKRKKVELRAVGKRHTMSELICNNGVSIVTDNLDRIYGIETFEGEETVRVGPGVTIEKLLKWLDKKDRALGYAVMGFGGLSVAGAVSTGAHGSSPRHISTIASLVKSMTLVKPNGEIEEFSSGKSAPDVWKALKPGLGLFGVIVDLRLKIRPQFNLEVTSKFEAEKNLFKMGPYHFIKGCDFAQIHWFPAAKKFMTLCGKETNLPVNPGAKLNLYNPQVPELFLKPVKEIYQMSACYNNLSCMMDKFRGWELEKNPPLLKMENRKLKSSNRVVGPSHKMLLSNVTPFAHRFFQLEYEVTIPFSYVPTAMNFYRKFIRKNKLCFPTIGVIFRFGQGDKETLIGNYGTNKWVKQGEPLAFFEIVMLRPIAFPQERMEAYVRPYEELVKAMIRNFHGRAHWGKTNRGWLMSYQKKLNVYGENFEKFQNVINKIDPEGLMSNEFTKKAGFYWPLKGNR
jgi:hypothetical protein